MLLKNTLIRNGVSIALVGSEDTGKDDGCIMFFDTAEYCRTGKFKGISVKTIDLVRQEKNNVWRLKREFIQHMWLPISEDAPVYSIEYCCGKNKSNRSGMCFRGFCENCSDKAYYIRESIAKHCSICEINKSVFFTREEAEAKLKEMEEKDGRQTFIPWKAD